LKSLVSHGVTSQRGRWKRLPDPAIKFWNFERIKYSFTAGETGSRRGYEAEGALTPIKTLVVLAV